MSNGDRQRIWQCIVWSDSAPKDWVSVIKKFQVPFVVSPYHDKDIKEDGTLKKAHWHVIFIFEGKKSYDQVKEITDSINAEFPVKVLSPRGAFRYLCHLDDKDKYQYHKDEIQCYNGADPRTYLGFSQTEIDIAKDEIQRFCLAHNIVEFCVLCDYAMLNEPVWNYVLKNVATNFFTKYLQSRRHLIINTQEVKKDAE